MIHIWPNEIFYNNAKGGGAGEGWPHANVFLIIHNERICHRNAEGRNGEHFDTFMAQ